MNGRQLPLFWRVVISGKQIKSRHYENKRCTDLLCSVSGHVVACRLQSGYFVGFGFTSLGPVGLLSKGVFPGRPASREKGLDI